MASNTRIEVQCYSGYKADERPLSFVLDGKKLMIDKIIDRWRTPGYDFFQVVADNGKTYLLKNDRESGRWVLEKVPGSPA
jgi:hypothetical protein